MKKHRVIWTLVMILAILLLIILLGGKYIKKRIELSLYPQKYTEYVEKYCKEFDVEPNLIYAVMKTESSFKPDAVSNVGARGLTQMMETTFDWVKGKLGDGDEVTYDSMFDPEMNIRYGTYLVGYLMHEFGNVEAAISAYHAGRGKVHEWLEDPNYSSDGVTLTDIPIKDTKHHVDKVKKALAIYNELYQSGGTK